LSKNREGIKYRVLHDPAGINVNLMGWRQRADREPRRRLINKGGRKKLDWGEIHGGRAKGPSSRCLNLNRKDRASERGLKKLRGRKKVARKKERGKKRRTPGSHSVGSRERRRGKGTSSARRDLCFWGAGGRIRRQKKERDDGDHGRAEPMRKGEQKRSSKNMRGDLLEVGRERGGGERVKKRLGKFASEGGEKKAQVDSPGVAGRGKAQIAPNILYLFRRMESPKPLKWGNV